MHLARSRTAIAMAASAALTLAVAGEWARAQPTLPEAYRRVDTWASRPQPRPAGEITAAAGVDVAADGSVFIVDAAEGNVHVLAPDGAGRAIIGAAGHGPGQLDRPADVDVRGGRAYVTDSGNRRVQVFDAATGRFVAAWPNLGRPHGIAVGAARAYVSDAESNRVWVLDLGGAVLDVWGGGDLDLTTPRGIDVDAAGTVAIADPGAGTIVVVGPDGRLATTLTRATANPDFMAVDVAIEGAAVYAVAPRQAFAFLSLDLVGVWVPGAYLVGGSGIAIGPGAGYVVTVRDNRADFSGAYHYPTRQPFSAQGVVWGGRRRRSARWTARAAWTPARAACSCWTPARAPSAGAYRARRPASGARRAPSTWPPGPTARRSSSSRTGSSGWRRMGGRSGRGRRRPARG